MRPSECMSGCSFAVRSRVHGAMRASASARVSGTAAAGTLSWSHLDRLEAPGAVQFDRQQPLEQTHVAVVGARVRL